MRQLTKQADITVALGEQLQSEADYLAELANRREPGLQRDLLLAKSKVSALKAKGILEPDFIADDYRLTEDDAAKHTEVVDSQLPNAALHAQAQAIFVDLSKDIACRYGLSTTDIFARQQTARIVDVLKGCDLLSEFDDQQLADVASRVVSKALLGDNNALALPAVSFDWIMSYLQMDEDRAERSACRTQCSPNSQRQHLKHRYWLGLLRRSLASKVIG